MPYIDPAGHSSATNCTFVQMLLKWPCSMNSECGRITTLEPIFAPPEGSLRVAFNFGNAVRRALLSRRARFGLNGSLEQPVAAYEELGLALLPPVEVRLATVSLRSHEVGLRAKFGRSS